MRKRLTMARKRLNPNKVNILFLCDCPLYPLHLSTLLHFVDLFHSVFSRKGSVPCTWQQSTARWRSPVCSYRRELRRMLLERWDVFRREERRRVRFLYFYYSQMTTRCRVEEPHVCRTDPRTAQLTDACPDAQSICADLLLFPRWFNLNMPPCRNAHTRTYWMHLLSTTGTDVPPSESI